VNELLRNEGLPAVEVGQDGMSRESEPVFAERMSASNGIGSDGRFGEQSSFNPGMTPPAAGRAQVSRAEEYSPGGMKNETASGPEIGKAYSAPSAATDQNGALLVETELAGFRTKWDEVQTSFVDEPREAVSQADALVASVMQRIVEQSASEREKMEKQWDRGEDVSTEDLRQALRRYRSFFDRLLKF
jgi:hypothetical protein